MSFLHFFTRLKKIMPMAGLVGLIFGMQFAHAQVGLTSRTLTSDEAAKGKYLTELAGCETCHTLDPSAPFAGGRAFRSHLGTIYSTNITSDPETGLGSWSDEEFYRAMHNGIGKDGRQLYPVMPYDAYTGLTREDIMLIKAWLMTEAPISKKDQPNELQFPYNYRQIILGWKLLNFYEGGAHSPTNHESPEEQRGIYIGEHLTFCGSCHTPRTVTMGTDPGRALTGAYILDNWYAPNITPDPIRGVGKWTDEELNTFLRTGEVSGKAYAMGPMRETIDNSLAHLTPEDMNSLLLWLRNIPFDGRLTSNETRSRAEHGRKQNFADSWSFAPEENSEIDSDQIKIPSSASEAEQIYYTMCASCHGMDGGGDVAQNMPNLARNTTLGMSNANNTIKMILEGSPSRIGSDLPPMPAFKDHLSDEQIATLTNWLFEHYGRKTTKTTTEHVENLRINALVGDAPIIALLKASSIALVAFGFIFILGWIVRFSPRVKAMIAGFRRKNKVK